MSASPRAPRIPRHSRRPRGRGWMRLVATVAVGALMFVGGGAFAVYNKVFANMGSSSGYDLADYQPTPEPQPEETTDDTPADPRAGQAMNILMLGSDSRDGDNLDIGGGEAGGARSDTTLLAHIPADRSRVDIVSIPRDLLTDIPECTYDAAEGKAGRAQSDTMFNAAFAKGAQGGDVHLGAVCAALTVNQMTGLVIDEYVVVDFSGFQRMVDSIGGIPMCIPTDMKNREADLDLQAGYQTLNGQQALAFARVRKGVEGGDGSDIQRIDRQQELLAATVRQVLSQNLVTDMGRLLNFLDASTKSLSVSQGLAPIDLAGLAVSLSSVGADGITFVTMPFNYAGPRVVANDLTEDLWERLRNDQPISTPEAPADSSTDTPDPGAGGTDPEAQPGDTPDGTGDATSPEGQDGGADPTQQESDPWNVVSGSDETVC